MRNHIEGWHRPLLVFAAAMGVLTLVSGVGLIVDDRVLVGSPIWHKPLKFSISLVLYGLTLAWMYSLLTGGRRVGWWAGTVVAAAGVVEMVVIVGQVVRGKRSHFNQESPLDAALFSVMGATIAVLWLATLVMAVVLWRQPLADRATGWAIRLGSVIGLAGLAVGFLMAQPTQAQLADGISDTAGAHSVGVPDGGPHLPVTGWSASGGDLRIAHFVGMHALQLLPLLALALTFAAGRYGWAARAAVRTRLVLVAAAGYAGLLALTTWQALRGQALTSPDALTLAAAAALVVGVLLGAALALRGASGAAPELHRASNRVRT
ncbi:hypothetical protein ACFWBN_36065 [Streptomyces sp. NPDC059989]|uniref:hypothetical protein n=1 Tax=Streptomyces sp. NPDC059989 TaxID=3347026 RepID=UPI0036856CC3